MVVTPLFPSLKQEESAHHYLVSRVFDRNYIRLSRVLSFFLRFIFRANRLCYRQGLRKKIIPKGMLV